MFCTDCGTKLGLGRRLLGRKRCASCARAQQTRIDAARTQYRELAAALADGTREVTATVPLLVEAGKLAAFAPTEKLRLDDDAFRRFANRTLVDDHLSDEEERDWGRIAEALGVDDSALRSRFVDVLRHVIIARANDGRLSAVASPHLICKKDEVVHAETEASLMKEKTIREYQGRYSGFSFQVVKGVRYHVGGTRGRSVVVGKQIVADDVGVLSVSSQRVVFMGHNSTVEMPYSKVVNIQVYTDGIQFHLSNRTTAPLFKVESGDVIAAVTNAAMQKLMT